MNINSLFFIGSSIWLLRFFRRLGVFGIFLFSVLDSSFLVFPFGNDVLLIALISSERSSIGWIVYVLAASVGSILGVLTVDFPTRAAGEKGLRRFVSQQRVEQLKEKLETKAGITVFLASVLPPPFPFTPVIMTASALQYPRPKIVGIVFGGRLLRYTVEAILALYLGRRLIRYINSEIFSYVVYGLIAVALIASALSVLKLVSKRRAEMVHES
ncbi:MAG TPA: VTT domain-containing protein [Pyrinomonadaceae bacterium]|nr:VTT domain-containing protein [Pyrinomonadaceae bacterium]